MIAEHATQAWHALADNDRTAALVAAAGTEAARQIVASSNAAKNQHRSHCQPMRSNLPRKRHSMVHLPRIGIA